MLVESFTRRDQLLVGCPRGLHVFHGALPLNFLELNRKVEQLRRECVAALALLLLNGNRPQGVNATWWHQARRRRHVYRATRRTVVHLDVFTWTLRIAEQ